MKPLNSPYYRPRAYLSAKVRAENHARNNTVASYLRGLFDLFLPHAFQSADDNHDDLSIDVYNMDIQAMEGADLAVLVPPIGRDCSFEVGWFIARNKPVYVYVQEDMSFLQDAMTVGGVTAVFTSNMEVYNRFMRQPVLKSKTYLLSDSKTLGKRILSSFNELKNGTVLMSNA